MKPILSVAEMRRIDAEATTPVNVLMDNAGYAVALAAADMGAGYGSVVHVLAGTGNNGGDGYVAARYLAKRGAHVRIHQMGEPEPGTPAGDAADVVAAVGMHVGPLGEVERGDLVIDALYGTGFRGVLPEETVPWTSTDMPVLSVDIPSGLDGDTGMADGAAFHAERTVALHALKLGHVVGDGPDLCGEVTVSDIGLSGGRPSMDLMTAGDVQIPERDRRSHKWSVGAVATIGGMPGLTGAALLAARTALRSGAGVSTIFTTASTAQAYEAMAPEIPTMQASESEGWSDHSSEVLSLLGRFQALVVGPGLEPAPPLFIDRLLEGYEGAIVVDAGAINAITRLDTLLERSAPTVITPHGAEFERLTGLEPTYENADRISDATDTVVLLKGNPTYVAGHGLTVIDSGGPELASIGTGDVLAGLIAALLAQGVPAESAARTGAYLHGLAGERLAGRSVVAAADLVDEVGRVVAEG